MPQNRAMLPDADPLAQALSTIAADAAAQDYPAHALYVVATPIGNRADITVRALACLARVDAVAAEDTRTTRALLRHYGIDRPMIAAHRHNEAGAAEAIVARIAGGARIAFVSDAGTPGISDPGARIARAVRDAGHRVIPVPGASALTAVVSAAGLSDAPITFVGFLPTKAAQVARRLETLATSSDHLVFYEAPHRIVDTLGALCVAFGGERSCVVAREVTKRFEAIHRAPLGEIVAWITADADRQRGEFVVIVEAPVDTIDPLARALPILEKLCAVLSVSEAASLAAELTGVSRKALYAEALKLRKD